MREGKIQALVGRKKLERKERKGRIKQVEGTGLELKKGRMERRNRREGANT